MVSLFSLILGVVLYFLPTIIAHYRDKPNNLFLWNLLLGWSGLGWLVLLVISLV